MILTIGSFVVSCLRRRMFRSCFRPRPLLAANLCMFGNPRHHRLVTAHTAREGGINRIIGRIVLQRIVDRTLVCHAPFYPVPGQAHLPRSSGGRAIKMSQPSLMNLPRALPSSPDHRTAPPLKSSRVRSEGKLPSSCRPSTVSRGQVPNPSRDRHRPADTSSHGRMWRALIVSFPPPLNLIGAPAPCHHPCHRRSLNPIPPLEVT